MPKPRPAPDPVEDSVLEQLLTQPLPETPQVGLQQGRIKSWSKDQGILQDNHPVQLSPSCLVQPMINDQVLYWSGSHGRYILQVLTQANPAAPTRLTSHTPLTIQAPVINLQSQSIQIKAQDFFSHVKHRHAVEQQRTETAKVRVVQVETDIRRAHRVFDNIKGGLIQRTGTWISRTVKTARHKARTFLFD